MQSISICRPKLKKQNHVCEENQWDSSETNLWRTSLYLFSYIFFISPRNVFQPQRPWQTSWLHGRCPPRVMRSPPGRSGRSPEPSLRWLARRKRALAVPLHSPSVVFRTPQSRARCIQELASSHCRLLQRFTTTQLWSVSICNPQHMALILSRLVTQMQWSRLVCWNLRPLLAMIVHSAGQSSTRTLFTMLFCSLTPQQCLIE